LKFSNFVITETAGSSVDPLGYLKPSGEVSSGLFRAFTVLSNHPAYQGFLAFVFSYLAGKNITPGRVDFSRRVRDLEILWGCLSVRGGDPVINVTKYEPLAADGELRLGEVQRLPTLYARLNYGALGHYGRPSAMWRILNPNGAGLTADGAALAAAWRQRDGLDFADLAGRWIDGEEVLEFDQTGRWSQAFRLEAVPSDAERRVWQTLINGLCVRDPIIAPLWQHSVPADIIALSKEEASYPGFYPALLSHYAPHAELCRRIRLCQAFARLSALVQFVFEWEYVRRLEQVRAVGLSVGDLPTRVTREIADAARTFLSVQGHRALWPLAATLAGITDYPAMVEAILAHHAQHQRSKGASPYIAGEAIAVQDRVDAPGYLRFFESVASAPDTLSSATLWRYPRNWHFERARLWQEYAGIQ